MSMRDREGLIARIRQIRRVAAEAENSTPGAAENAARAAPEQTRSPAAPADSDAGAVRTLEARMTHLEQMVEGLQDSTYRELDRQGKLIAELQAQVQPAAMGAALSRDARDRGL